MSMSNGVTGGNFTSVEDLQGSSPNAGTVLTITTLGTRIVYSVDDSDLGEGISLPETDGLFANPTDRFLDIIIDTALVIGGKYFSSVTKSHTVPTGVNIGDEIQITWKDGTTMTLTSAVNISLTSAEKVTDTTWTFTNFIALLTLVWDGTEWGIK